MQYKLKKSKKRKKTMSVTINDAGIIVVTTPVWTSKEQADDFVKQSKKWILKQQEKILKNPPDTTHIYYLGQKYLFDEQNHSLVKPKLKVNNGLFTFYSNTPISIDQKNKLLEKFYKHQAKKVIPDLVNKYCNIIKKDYNKITIKNVSTRWGSCSTKNNLNFNYKLMKTPIDCVEYVVAHEVCHLKHHNHSKNFWNLVKSVFPNYKECEKHLKQNQHIYL